MANELEPTGKSFMFQHLEKATQVLEKFNIQPSQSEVTQLTTLLNDVLEVDQPRVGAIGRVMHYMGSFNQLVRDEIRDIKVQERYQKVSELFDSVRDDAKRLVEQLDDGKIDLSEKLSNVWMKISRGSIAGRFEKIGQEFNDVTADTAEQIETEKRILDAYADFRVAVKEAEAMAYEVESQQKQHVEATEKALDAAQQAVSAYQGDDKAERTRLELQRDQAIARLKEERSRHQLIADVAQQLKIGYNVGETVMGKLAQTHDVKKALYRRSVTFFRTNEHVFTALGATYTSQLGLHEATETMDAMTSGINKGLETVADLGGRLEKEAAQAAYGKTISAESVQKLVDAIVRYQTETQQEIRKLQQESRDNAETITHIVEEGKQRVLQAIRHYKTTAPAASPPA